MKKAETQALTINQKENLIHSLTEEITWLWEEVKAPNPWQGLSEEDLAPIENSNNFDQSPGSSASKDQSFFVMQREVQKYKELNKKLDSDLKTITKEVISLWEKSESQHM